MKKFVMAVSVAALVAFCAPAFAAMNPFMDVPASHWAYDAVATLAARGVISGYPDGTYKGARPTTRYEMASALARALAVVDMEKASKQDVEMLKRLVVEFKDELDALGVKVDALDSRVAVLEKDLGGWSMAGQLRFDAKFTNNDKATSLYGVNGKNDFNLNRYRFWIRKRINETTSFETRLGTSDPQGSGNVVWQRYYITTKIGYDITMTVGRQWVDWEASLKLTDGNYFDGIHGVLFGNMFRFQKDWGRVTGDLVITRLDDNSKFPVDDSLSPLKYEQFMVAGLLNWNASEKFRAGLMAYYAFSNGDEKSYMDATTNTKVENDSSFLTLGVYAGYKFVPGVELKGVYYHQKQGDWFKTRNAAVANEDKAKFWRAILTVDQDVLKFTGLWVEYGQLDNNYLRTGHQYGQDWGGFFGGNILADGKMPINTNTTKILNIHADQKWNDKWASHIWYATADFDTDNWDKAKVYGLAVDYRLNPAVLFQLGYEKLDYGQQGNDTNGTAKVVGDENMIRFRTYVTF